MKASIITCFAVFTCLFSFSQERQDTIYTDTSMITVETLHSGSRTTYEFFKNKNRVRYQYVNRNGYIETQGYYDRTNKKIGSWKEYDEESGKLLRIEDHDKREWIAVEREKYPYKALLDEMRGKADSIVTDWYGEPFFKKYLKWSMDESSIYDDKYKDQSKVWTKPTAFRPARFIVKYDLILDSAHIYNDMIWLEINAKGEIIIGDGYNNHIQGFEKVAKNSVFKLSPEAAIEKAKLYGLIETDSSKAECFLKWYYFETGLEKIANGSFGLYVAEKTGTEKFNRGDNYSITTVRYNVYLFNPWTGDFMEKWKMKNIHRWEGTHGGSTGLIPDE